MLVTEDFTIVVRDLPDHNEFSNLKELKALLWNHLEKVISEEPQVKSQFAQSEKHSQIVNIHFGLKSFGKMKILMKIYNDLKKQKRE